MSKSTSKTSARRSSTAQSTKAPKVTITEPPRHPWIIDGIDYGPAAAALGDLASWAFEVAAADVGDWPVGLRRVRNAQRYVLARIDGKRPRLEPMEDILFTAGLLVRIFETRLPLSFSDMVAVLDQLGLPTEVVPIVPRVQSSATLRAPVPYRDYLPPLRAPSPEQRQAPPTALTTRAFGHDQPPRGVVTPFAPRRTAPAPDVPAVAPCEACGCVPSLFPPYRNAA